MSPALACREDGRLEAVLIVGTADRETEAAVFTVVTLFAVVLRISRPAPPSVVGIDRVEAVRAGWTRRVGWVLVMTPLVDRVTGRLLAAVLDSRVVGTTLDVSADPEAARVTGRALRAAPGSPYDTGPEAACVAERERVARVGVGVRAERLRVET